MEKYTIVIPTRDRAEMLDATLRTCIRQAYPNFEIIVSDNCSADNTRQIVEQFRDPRIRYVNPGRRLSMAGNFEFALRHVSEGFVMFIGADDGVMPDAIRFVNSIVEKHDVDAVACRQATYVWPNFPEKSLAGRLTFGGWRDDVEIRRSAEWIKAALTFSSFYCFDLPSLYCGFVHKRIIDKAYKDGKYFRSITPDAFSAFATAIFAKNFAYSNRPFSIAGASFKSNGASELHPVGDINESTAFHAENDIEIADGFVRCPSYEVILGEAFAKLAEAFPEQCAPYRINYLAMLENAIANSNSKTECAVTSAASTMAGNFGVTLTGKRLASTWRRVRLRDVVSSIGKFIGPSRLVALERSADFGIKDVDDAALAAHVLSIKRSNKAGFVTSRDLVIQKLKQMVGLKSFTRK